MTYIRIRFGRHATITIEIGREEWLLLLVLSGCFAVGTFVTIWVRGLTDWLRIGIEALALYLILIGVYVLSFSTAEWFARAQARVQELIYHELAERDTEIVGLNREAKAGAIKEQVLETQTRTDAKYITHLEGEIAKLKSESQMQQEIDMLRNVITNQQSHIDEMEGRLQRRTSGQGLAEYAIILVCIALVIMAVAWTFPEWAASVFDKAQRALQ